MNHQLFHPYQFNEAERKQMNRDGHLIYPGLLTSLAQEKLTQSLEHIHSLDIIKGYEPNRFSAEYDSYLEELITHPQMLDLVEKVLGNKIRYDHCVSLNRPGGNGGIGWHSHGYAEDDHDLGFVRIFFYVNGFTIDDGGLKVVPGSHLFRDAQIQAKSDSELETGWMKRKYHPMTGQPLAIEKMSVSAGTVILVWTHAAHAVTPRQESSDTRWTVVYAYRNPGQPSGARWISPEYETQKRLDSTSPLKDLIALY